MRDERRIDTTGDMATANVERLYRPIVWSLRTTVEGDKVTTVIPYHINSRNNPPIFEMSYTFSIRELLGLIPREATKFDLPILDGQAARKRDQLNSEIDVSMKRLLAGLGDQKTAIDQCLNYFKANVEIASNLRKAAMYDSFVAVLKKPKGWEDYIKNFLPMAS